MILKPGAKLWLVPFMHYAACEVTVATVGRKWVTLEGHYARFDIETGQQDGKKHASPGRVYASREEYEREEARRAAWTQFRRAIEIRYYPSNEATIENIEKAKGLLGLI